MRLLSLLATLLVVSTLGCGALKNLPEFDPSESGVRVDAPVAPADGVTEVQVRVVLRYSAAVAAPNISVVLNVTGATARLKATAGVTDANGIFATTLTSSTPGVARLAANIQGQVSSPALQATVQFVSVAAGASLALGPQATVGEPETAVLTILDASGQRVLYYVGTVAFSSSDPLAILPPLYQFTAGDQGQHSFEGIAFNTAGTQSLRVKDAGNANIFAEVGGIEVGVKTAPMLAVSGLSSALAGTVNQVQVRAVDISQHTQTGYTGTVHLTSSDPAAELPADTTITAADAGIKVLRVVLKTAGIQSVSAVDANNLAINGTQGAVAVWVQADRFRVVAQPQLTAGTAASTQIVAVDGYGNVDPNYIGPAVFTSSDPRATLPSRYAFTLADAGAHDANLTFYSAGRQTLDVQGASAGFSGEANVTVAGGLAQSLALLGPLQATAGSIITLVVTAYDRYGNVSGSYSGTLTLSSSDAHAVLLGPVTVTVATTGSAVLTPVIFKTAGVQTVTITDANRALSAQAQIAVVNGATASFALSGLASVTAGQTQSVTVAALDAFGNSAVDYTGSVVVSSDDVQAQLPPLATFTLLDAGTRILTPVVLKTAGLRRVDVADTADPNMRGIEPNILVVPLGASALVVITASQAAVGVAQNVVVLAVDAYGNIDPNFAGTVTLTSSDTSASLPAPYSFGPGDAGRATLTAVFYTSDMQTVVASWGGVTSAPALVDVVATAAAKLGLSGLTSGRAGRAQTFVIQALDNFNNLVPGYIGSIEVTSSDGNAVLPGIVTLAASDGGQKLVPVTLVTAGSQAVTAHDVSAPSIAGTQGNVLVVAVADRLRVQAPTALTAGASFILSVAGVDAYDNVDTTYTGTVSLSSTSASSTLPATLSIMAGMQGVAMDNNVALLGAGANLSITAQDILQPLAGSRSGILVRPGPAASLLVQGPGLDYVSLPFVATLTAYDVYGNQATGYTGAVMLTSSDPGASLGGITTFISAAQGSATAAGLIWSAANTNATLTATDTQTPSITGSQTGIVVRAGGAAKMRLFGPRRGWLATPTR